MRSGSDHHFQIRINRYKRYLQGFSHLQSCLRGIAQRWYIEELEDTTRLAFRFAPEGIELWAKHLIERFKDSVPSAVKKLRDEVYTKDDALDGRDVRGYAAMVMRHAKAADMDKTHQQLSYVYNNLDAEFRMQINTPDEKTVASEWLKGLASKQEAWKDALVARQRSRYQVTNHDSLASTEVKTPEGRDITTVKVQIPAFDPKVKA